MPSPSTAQPVGDPERPPGTPSGHPHPADETDQPRRRGRPRDPLVEDRTYDAALDIFGRKGWAGFTMSEVAAEARVGKSSLYRRWTDRQGLLIAALQARQPTMRELEPGESLRDYLVEHALRRADSYLGPYGPAFMRLYAEVSGDAEEFAEVRAATLTRSVLMQRGRLERAIREAHLDPGASPTQILDVIEGAVLMHVLVTPPELRERLRAALATYVVDLVDTQLARWRP